MSITDPSFVAIALIFAAIIAAIGFVLGVILTRSKCRANHAASMRDLSKLVSDGRLIDRRSAMPTINDQ